MLHYSVSSEFMIQRFGSHTFKVNAQMLSGAYPVLKDLYGPQQELELEFKIKKPRVAFGLTDDDVGL